MSDEVHGGGRAPTSVRLPFGPEAPRAARRLVDALLSEIAASPEAREDAALVVHELVSNGVLHGSPDAAGELGLAYAVRGQQLLITVVDDGTEGTVEVQEPDHEAASGRGLAIVAALADDWSVDRSQGTAVSARLKL